MYDKVPDELKSLHQWVCYKLVEKPGQPKPAKIPVDPKTGNNAKSNDASTWGTFNQAFHGFQLFECTGIGIMLGNGLIGIDIDGCIQDGGMTVEAKDIIEIMNSYTERSPSGKGIHILAFATKPHGACRKGNIEMYGTGRFFTVTGDAL